ncbi:T9SS type A sorting domain-containing protein, partial [candidate division KSB1 bacterium]|nr:T9SS type A sorting domain-containing protein [candidate division KSB1 bacterium]
MAGTWADYDDDGDQDLFIAPGDDYPVFLYRNEGDGTFTDVSIEAGFGSSFGNCRAAVWGDYDNDGDLDIFIGRRTYDETPDMDICQLFRNDGGLFTEIESARIQGKVIYGVATGDYDNDGDLDLHLLDSDFADLMLRNDGDFAFTDVTEEAHLIKAASPSGWGELAIGDRGGQTWADWDADGDLDLMLPGESGKIPYMMRNDGGNENNWLEVKLTGVQSNRSAVGTRVTAISGDLVQAREVCMGTGYVAGPPTDVHFGFGQRTVIDSLIIKWSVGTIDVLTDVNVNQILEIEEGSTVSSVEVAEPEVPSEFKLSQNYPNPFNPFTTISYTLAQPDNVRLDVYSMLGRHVMTLVDGYKSSGTHTVTMDAGHLTAGVYVYRIKVNDFEIQKKMIILK